MMQKKCRYAKVISRIFVCAAGLVLSGCGRVSQVQEYEKNKSVMEGDISAENTDLSEALNAENAVESESEIGMKPEAGKGDGQTETKRIEAPDGYADEKIVENSNQNPQAEPVIIDADWSEYFNGLNGTAVLYDAAAGEYILYNRELAMTQSSPCSTFKIVSSLIALENGVIDPGESVRTWSGEVFWNENWNHDIDFQDAFRVSCVWYFRELIDETGKETIQQELDRLRYGNCDISDWEGRLNTNNSNRALTGFWIESSLKISPKEQVDVMERIFGKDSVYSEKSQDELKKVMLVQETQREDLFIYGKTGMGKAQGIVVDAWFTGFAEARDKTVYYCVRLGESDNIEVSSQKAKEIAISIVSDYYR